MMTNRESVSDLVSFVVAMFRRENLKPTVIFWYSIVAMTSWWYLPNVLPLGQLSSSQAMTRFLQGTDPISWPVFFLGSMKILAAFVLFGVLPMLIVRLVFHESLADYGVQWGIKRRTVRTLLMFLPLMILAGYFSGKNTSFLSVYPYNPFATQSSTFMAVHCVMYFFLYYFAWEFMFRGFIQHGLEESFGAIGAVWTQVMATTLLHLGHPFSEVVACACIGLLWGFLVYRTRSLVSGWIQHATVGLFLDLGLFFQMPH